MIFLLFVAIVVTSATEFIVYQQNMPDEFFMYFSATNHA
jgi:hypothetical protein